MRRTSSRGSGSTRNRVGSTGSIDVRTFSEQVFSVGKGSLNLDSLMHRGREWATLHSVAVCVVMLAVAKTATEIERPDLIRCVRNFNG